MTALYQQNLTDQQFPYKVFRTRIQEFPPHCHEEYEVVFNLANPFEIVVEDCIITIGKGDIYVVEPRVIHSFRPQSTPQNRLIIQFKPIAIDKVVPSKHHFRLAQTHISKDDMNPLYGCLSNLLFTVQDEYTKQSVGYEYLILSKIYELIGTLLRSLDVVDCSIEEIQQRDKRINRLQKVFE